jgi:oligopeptide/dipeptide ABC transporter ATP-binding protein
LLRLIEPTAGKVMFDGRDVTACSGAELRELRRRMQIIFQDPYGSLNPRMTVGSIVGEAVRVHGLAKGRALDARIEELLERVGLPAVYRSRYPHEFSGGQRQRIGVARALALRPDFIVCDEAVSALDVSIQAQVLNLLADLQQEFELSYLFISHDLNVVRHVADRVGVMYLGRLVEVAETEELFRNPRHPYTRALISANPVPDPDVRVERIALTGEVPSALNPPSGCHFHPRCPRVMDRCSREDPAPEIFAGGHMARCFLAGEPEPSGS